MRITQVLRLCWMRAQYAVSCYCWAGSLFSWCCTIVLNLNYPVRLRDRLSYPGWCNELLRRWWQWVCTAMWVELTELLVKPRTVALLQTPTKTSKTADRIRTKPVQVWPLMYISSERDKPIRPQQTSTQIKIGSQISLACLIMRAPWPTWGLLTA